MTAGSHTSLLSFGPHHVFPLPGGFSCQAGTPLARGFPFRACAFPLCPHSSDIQQYRNLNLLSIGYASRPRLRPRLTQSRSALLWKPWIFGLEDSHLHLATQGFPPPSRYSFRHSLFHALHSPSRYCFVAHAMLLYQRLHVPQLRCRVSAPDIFGAGPLDQ